MIELKNINKMYNNKIVVDDFNLEVIDKSITTIIGPNGAGKSTVLSIMSRLLQQDNGYVMIDGKDIKNWKTNDLAKHIAILKQSNIINIRLTVYDLVSFGRFPHSEGILNKQDIREIERAIEYMELKDIQNKYIDNLSGGQLQRAYIAMVLAQDTKYILLDEPLNNLDMKYCVQMMRVLRRLVDELDKTIVTVLHDINFANFYSDYIVTMRDGKLVKADKIDEVITEKGLSDLYDMEIKIKEIDNKKICIYY